MRFRAIQIAISAVFVCSAQTQSPARDLDRVFHFRNTQTPAGFKQVADPIRGMTEGTQVSVDDAAATLTVHGTADQLAMAEWLFVALDKPAVGQPPAQHAASADYHVPGSEDLVRVYYLAHSEPPQNLQEMTNVIRANADIQRAFPNNAAKALTVRGTAGQLGVAAYVIDALDKPAGQPNQHSATAAFPVPASPGQVARVFYFANVDSPRRLQETVNLIRSLTDMRIVFPYNSLKAVALRGTASEMAVAEWLFNGLDKPAPQPSQHTATAEYLPPPSPENRNPVVRIFYLAHSEPPQGPQEITNLIRVTTDAQRVYPYPGLNAVAMRGTATQVALAAWLFETLDQPSQNQPSQNQPAQEFQVAGASNDVARVFYLTHTATPAAVQELSTLIRTTTSIMRLFPYSSPRALAMRGTPDQLALAARLIQERDK